jgi:hypothetical protein
MTAAALQVALGASPAAAISTGGLLSYAFQGLSWERWRACLKAAWAETMTPEEETLFREVAGGRNAPTARVRELWCVLGRRAGKDSVASAIVTSVALQDHRPHLRPGEKATCMCIASTADQARIINRYVRAYFAEGTQLRQFVTKETDDVLELSTGAELIVTAGNFRAVRGRALACAVLDEIAFYPSLDAANSDVELLAALEPAMETLPGAILVGISSPYRRSGVMFERWAKYHGKDDPDILVLHAPTKMFNPLVRNETIAKALERDPDKAASEWMAAWRDDIGAFIDRALVETAVEPGIVARSPQFDAEYSLFVDASGGRGSSFTACVAHSEGETVFIDALFERRAPFDPAAIVGEVAALAREYRIGTVRGDRYAASWVSEAFAKEGLIYTPSERDKSELYLGLLPLFTSGRIHLLDNPRVSFQLASLERHVTKFGRDRVSAPSGGADDLANAVAGAAVNAVADGPALVKNASVFAAAVPMPERAQHVFSATVIGQDGMVATAFFATNSIALGWNKDECFLLDCTLGPLGVDTVYTLTARLTELRGSIGPGFCSAWVTRPLEQQVKMDGYPSEIFDETRRLDLPMLAVQFSSLVHAGQFKIVRELTAKARTMPLAAALSFRPNERIEDNTLRLAIIEGARLGMMNAH